MQARWIPNRGILLLLYASLIVVYDADLGTVLERIALPRRCKPFSRWLVARGHMGVLGAAAQGGLSTLVLEHEVCL